MHLPVSKYLFWCGLFVCAGIFANRGFAQNAPAPDKPPLPVGSLLNPAPDFCKWQESYSYPEDHPKVSDGSAPPPLPDTFFVSPRTVVTTKTKNRVHEEIYDLKARETERWFTGADQYTKPFGDKDWEKSMKGGHFDPYAAPIPPSGFRDLDIVTAANYAGTLKTGEKSYLIFVPGGMTTLTQDQLNDPKVLALQETLAIIDDATRLPISAKVRGVTRVYQYLTPPVGIQDYPQDLIALMEKEASDNARLYRTPPRAY